MAAFAVSSAAIGRRREFPSVAKCEEMLARYDGGWTSFYGTRAGAKSVLYCAPRSMTLVIAR